MKKYPYILVVGAKEEENKTVNVREKDKGSSGEISLEDFIKKLSSEIKYFS